MSSCIPLYLLDADDPHSTTAPASIVTVGDSDIVKAKSTGEDPRPIGGLVSDLPHSRVNQTKQHTSSWAGYSGDLTKLLSKCLH